MTNEELISKIREEIERMKIDYLNRSYTFVPAAMEQLLSGKKRLPGFKGEWIDFNLGQFGRMVRL